MQDRFAWDPAFRNALLEEGVECLLSDEVDVGKSLLRDYANTTVGFHEFGRLLQSRLSIEQRQPYLTKANSS